MENLIVSYLKDLEEKKCSDSLFICKEQMEIEIEERAWILIELTFFKGEKISERAKILQCVKTGSTSQQMSVV